LEVEEAVLAETVPALGYLRALANPLRLRILSLLAGPPRSAAQVARALGINHASASYHLRTLLGAGIVTTAGERAARGGRERLYRHSPVTSEVVGDRPSTPPEWGAFLAALGAELQRRAIVAVPRPKWVSDAQLWVAPAALERARRAVGDALLALEAAATDPATPGTTHVSATALLFEMDDADAAAG